MAFRKAYLKLFFVAMAISVPQAGFADAFDYGYYTQTDMPDCRAWIADHICLVDKNAKSIFFAPCTNEKHVEEKTTAIQKLQASYDLLHPALQKVFCTIQRINVQLGSKGFSSLAMYAGNLSIPYGALIGPVVPNSLNTGLQQQVDFVFYKNVKDAIEPTVWFSSSLDPSKKMAPIEIPNMTVGSSGFSMLIHELAHLIRRYNTIGDFLDPDALPDCPPKNDGNKCDKRVLVPNTWATLSWLLIKGEDFAETKIYDYKSIFEIPDPKTGEIVAPHQRLADSYLGSFAPPAPLEIADTFLKELYQTSFLSPAMAMEPEDDWADGVKFYFLFKMIKPSDTLAWVSKKGEIFDLKAQFNSPRFAAKKAFLEKFFSRTDLIYPKPIPLDRVQIDDE
jgi:hypothetical protein